MSNQTGCDTSETAQEAFNQLFDLTYRIVGTSYLTIGLTTNLILLMAFYKQSKTESAYGYQVVFTISKALEIFFYGIFAIAQHWFLPSGYDWFLTNYVLVRFHTINLGLLVSFIVSSLLFAVAMASDRLYAIVAPLAYSKINAHRRQIVTTISCLGLGFLVGGVMFFAAKVQKVGNRYIPVPDLDLIQTPYWRAGFSVMSLFRIGAVLFLAVLNPVMVVVFHRATKKAAHMNNNDKERMRADRDLMWINAYQLFMMVLSQLPHTVWTSLLYLQINFCGQEFAEPITVEILMILDILDFFIVISINKRMRRLVFNLLPCRSNDIQSLT